MTASIRLLVGILSVQILFAIIVWGFSHYRMQRSVSVPLTIPIEAIHYIEMIGNPSSKQPSSLILKKHNGRWRMSQYDNLLANGKKIEALLNVLSNPQRMHLISHSPETQSRFALNVDQAPFRWKIQGKDKVLSILFGQRASTQSIYVRQAQDDAIYEVRLGGGILEEGLSEQLSSPNAVNTYHWINRQQIQLRHTLQKIEGKDFSLQRQKKQWILSPLKPDEHPKQSAIEQFVVSVAELLITDIAPLKRVEKLRQTAPHQTLTLHYQAADKNKEKQILTYRFFKSDNNDIYLDFGQSTWVIPAYIDAKTILASSHDQFVERSVNDDL